MNNWWIQQQISEMRRQELLDEAQEQRAMRMSSGVTAPRLQSMLQEARAVIRMLAPRQLSMSLVARRSPVLAAGSQSVALQCAPDASCACS